MPNLKSTVDIKLESDWHNAQWTSVGTIAAQRYRATKDAYYLVCAIYLLYLSAMKVPREAMIASFHRYFPRIQDPGTSIQW